MTSISSREVSSRRLRLVSGAPARTTARITFDHVGTFEQRHDRNVRERPRL